MASLYKRKNAEGKVMGSWYCAFRVAIPGGGYKQVHKSTGKKSKKDAERVAFQLEQQSIHGGADGTDHGEAIQAKLNEAGELAMRGRLNQAQARRILGEIMEITEGENLVNYSLRGWIDDWIREKEGTTKKATVAFYKSSTKDFLNFLGKRADLPIDAITPRDVRRFRDSVKANGRTSKTCNHKLKGLRSMFKDALTADLILRNPAASIKSLTEDDSTEREPFTIDQVQTILESITNPDWQGVTLLGCFAGLRLGDAANLTSDNIQMKRKVIHFTPAKSRKKEAVEVPMHPELVAYFKAHKPSPFKGAPLFPSLAGRSPGGRGGLSHQFGEIMDTAGIDRQIKRTREAGAPRATSSLSFHSLRHTFASWLAEADVPEEVRMKMTGHTDSTVHQKYTHQQLSTLRGAVDRLQGLTKKGDKAQ